MKWILCKDQMPTYHKRVLFLLYNSVWSDWVMVGHREKHGNYDIAMIDGSVFRLDPNSRWMPLPDSKTGYDSFLLREYNRGWCDSSIIPSEEVNS